MRNQQRAGNRKKGSRPLGFERLESRRMLAAVDLDLLLDVNAAVLDSSSSPRDFVSMGTHFYFTASTPLTNRELWRSDGTAAGTSLVSDVNPGKASSDLSNLTRVGETLFFVARDEAHGFELWKSDGTAAGTVRVKDINPGSGDSHPSNLVAWQRQVGTTPSAAGDEADGDGSDSVGSDDLAIWMERFGDTAGAPVAALARAQPKASLAERDSVFAAGDFSSLFDHDDELTNIWRKWRR